MTKEFNLRNTLYISAEPDEDGDVMLTSRSTTIFMTRKEMRQMRDHLNALLENEPKAKPLAIGTDVRILRSSHKDLIGKTGQVWSITPSGNVEVRVKNEAVMLAPSSVEVL